MRLDKLPPKKKTMRLYKNQVGLLVFNLGCKRCHTLTKLAHRNGKLNPSLKKKKKTYKHVLQILHYHHYFDYNAKVLSLSLF